MLAQSKSGNILLLKSNKTIEYTKKKTINDKSTFYMGDSMIAILPNYLIDTGSAQVQNIVPETPNKDLTPTSSDDIKEKNNKFSFAFGLSLGNLLEFNNPSGTADKNSFSFNGSFDFMHRYEKPSAIFTTSNELHYTLGIQKEDIGPNNYLQRSQDNLQTLHDYSFAFTKKRKWNINLIAKTNLPLFSIFDGEYFADWNALGKIQAFASPYSLTLSPGIKYNASEAFRISISPYSSEFYGVLNTEVSNKGIFISDTTASGSFKKHIIKKQGVEMNIWFDKRVKEWLDMQYRVSFNSDYKGGIFRNGAIDGLLITKIKLIKNVYLTQRVTIANSLTNNFLKPYLTQNVQLSYSQNF